MRFPFSPQNTISIWSWRIRPPIRFLRSALGVQRERSGALAMDARREAKNETYLEQMLVFFGGAGEKKEKSREMSRCSLQSVHCSRRRCRRISAHSQAECGRARCSLRGCTSSTRFGSDGFVRKEPCRDLSADVADRGARTKGGRWGEINK